MVVNPKRHTKKELDNTVHTHVAQSVQSIHRQSTILKIFSRARSNVANYLLP